MKALSSLPPEDQERIRAEVDSYPPFTPAQETALILRIPEAA